MMKATLAILLNLMILVCFIQSYKLQELSLKDWKKGYDFGYNRAKLIYECDHDRAECEIIKDTL